MGSKKHKMFAWIEASIRYCGRFSQNEKIAYGEIFGLSEATISRHQAEFQAGFEDHCRHEVFVRDVAGRIQGGKLVLKDGADVPHDLAFDGAPTLDQWLAQAFRKDKYIEVQPLRSEPKPWIVRILVSALMSKFPVFITYGSRSKASERLISPLVIVKVAGRHHVRAYDHMTNEPRDFVLSRIIHIEERKDKAYFDADPEWKTFEDIIIEEKKDPKSNEHISGVRLDFELDETGVRVVRVRKALAQYLIDDMRDGYESPVRMRRMNSENIES